MTSIAERSAWTMVIRDVGCDGAMSRAPACWPRAGLCDSPSRWLAARITSAAISSGWLVISDPQFLALPAQVRRHVLVDVLEHVGGTGRVAAGQRAVALGLLLGRRNHRLGLLVGSLVTL